MSVVAFPPRGRLVDCASLAAFVTHYQLVASKTGSPLDIRFAARLAAKLKESNDGNPL